MKQQTNLSRSISETMMSDTEYNTLGSYFMVHLYIVLILWVEKLVIDMALEETQEEDMVLVAVVDPCAFNQYKVWMNRKS